MLTFTINNQKRFLTYEFLMQKLGVIIIIIVIKANYAVNRRWTGLREMSILLAFV